MSEEPDEGTPLIRGPLYGLAYCAAGAAVAVGADLAGGWVSIPIWIVAGVLFLAGIWTALFAGVWLLLIHRVKRRSADTG